MKKKFKDRKIGKLLIGLAKSKLAKAIIEKPLARAIVKIGLPFIGTPLIETLKNINHNPETVKLDGEDVAVMVGLPHKSVKHQWIISGFVVLVFILWVTGILTQEQFQVILDLFVK